MFTSLERVMAEVVLLLSYCHALLACSLPVTRHKNHELYMWTQVQDQFPPVLLADKTLTQAHVHVSALTA